MVGKTLALFLALSSSVWASPDPSKVVEILTHVSPGMVAGGTGFVVEAPSGLYYTLTNAHVCAKSTDGMMDAVSEYQGKAYPHLHIVRLGINIDLCALEPVPHVPPTTKGNDPHPLQQVYIMGHPKLGPLTTSQGYVETMGGHEFLTTARVQPGNSGSPIMDRFFRLVGIVNQYDPNTGASYGIDLAAIVAFLKGL